MASIRKRVRKDGTSTWQVMWRETDGTQTGITFYTEPEAKSLQAALKANGGSLDLAQQAIVPTTATRTVADVVQEHLDLLIKPTPNTMQMYRGYLNNHIMDSIGGVPVDQLNRKQVAAWVRGLMSKRTGPDRTMAPKTVRNVATLLASSMETAVELGYRESNPCKGVDLPSDERAEDDVVFLTVKEFTTLRDAIDPHYRVFVSFLVLSGARFGEAAALTVDDVNLISRPATVRINKAWKSDGRGHFLIGPPKTPSSRRTVAIPESLATLLQPLASARPSSARLFVDDMGERIEHRDFYHGYWKPAVKKAKATDPLFKKNPKPHGLRHTHASWLIQEGVELFKVARRLGHSSTGMVERVYGHLMPDAQADSVSALGRAMLGDGLPELEALKEDPEES